MAPYEIAKSSWVHQAVKISPHLRRIVIANYVCLPNCQSRIPKIDQYDEVMSPFTILTWLFIFLLPFSFVYIFSIFIMYHYHIICKYFKIRTFTSRVFFV